ncbi:hypothetical protein Acy02nite_86590 [Actinoplanes cyaneus]|uniref:Peptidoglycan binding domain-containing protein n=1 Tax=Actinoplanes cyaneus TaxID=52696 RepID=A0A919MAQ5_9ACTN|nr:hypothetical protein [Actinoplanes cyaneus]MCW2144087.1 hypothetical protein [Actinoplanes cyaneus]GID70778.1 hypothetical protein Acy02nite_86590 [Actinoplanes cyaneus]
MKLALPRSGPSRIVAVISAAALVTGAIGWLVGTQVRSPADAAAGHRPPPASLITVAVEQRALTATVNAQGTLQYGTPQPVTLTGSVAVGEGDPAAAPLITKAPTANRTLRAGDMLLEVSGRPVFVLPGKVPMYRTLTRGSAGDDVRQLRAALRLLLPDRNISSSGAIDDNVLNAVKAWYDKRGYQAAGPTPAQRTQLRQLEQAAETARAAGGTALADARTALSDYRKTYGTSIASGEILFLPKLPVRLVTVTAKTGAPASGVIGTVADPTLVVNGTVTPDDAGLLKVGMAATLQHPAGDQFPAKLTALGAAAAPAPEQPTGQVAGGQETAAPSVSGIPIQLAPAKPGSVAAFTGQAFKVVIKVGGTGQAVLSVPVAAVFTSADGQARVSVQDASGAVRDVPVRAGLSTGGFVQITPEAAGSVVAGDRVVVGTQ